MKMWQDVESKLSPLDGAAGDFRQEARVKIITYPVHFRSLVKIE